MSQFETTPSKRAKLDETSEVPNSTNFKAKLEALLKDDPEGSSQEGLYLYSHLLELIDDIDSLSAIQFFLGSKSDKEEMKIQKIIESGQDAIDNLEYP